MNEQQLHETIESYLNNKLNPSEKETFEKQLAADAALQQEVARHRKAELAIAYAYHQSAKARLKKLDAEITSANSRQAPLRMLVIRRLSIAAGFLILVVAGIFFYAQSTYSTDAFAEQMFAPVPAEHFRNREEYVSALGEKFAEAESLFRTRKYEEAKHLYLVIIKEDSLFKDQAEWNLMLSYYALDPESPQFKILYDRIRTDSTHDYHEQALELEATMSGILYKIVH